jgi:hypothetical protein
VGVTHLHHCLAVAAVSKVVRAWCGGVTHLHHRAMSYYIVVCHLSSYVIVHRCCPASLFIVSAARAGGK